MKTRQLQPKTVPGIDVSFAFESGEPFRPGVLESLARSVQGIARRRPFDAAEYSFFDATKVSDWFSGHGLREIDGGAPEGRGARMPRLRAITCGAKTLLENRYGPDGRLVAATYFDGEVVSYDFDDVARTSTIRSTRGHETIVSLQADDLPRKVDYGKSVVFEYEYDDDGNVRRLVYPDGVGCEWTFGTVGELVSARCGSTQIALRWNRFNALDGYVMQCGDDSVEFRVGEKRQRWSIPGRTLEPAAPNDCSIHVLGRWRFDREHGIEEMLTPWGERLRIAVTESGRPLVTWCREGLQSFDYASDGRLASTTHVDGSRSVAYRLPSSNSGLMVSPWGVTLQDWDDAGCLRRTLSSSGEYCLMEYGRGGRLRKMRTEDETVSVTTDIDGRILAIFSDAGYYARIERSPTGEWTGFTAEGFRADAVATLVRMLTLLWGLLGLKTPHCIAAQQLNS